MGLGTNVYNMDLFHPLEKLPSDGPVQHIAYAVDAGHINSITTCLAGGITALNILYFAEYLLLVYESKLQKSAK